MKKKENVPAQVQEAAVSGENQELENNSEGEGQEQENGSEGEGQEQENGSEGEGQEQEGGSGGEDQDPDEVLKVLTALYPILYLSHQYKVGDVLPANDLGMVEAWLQAGTAAWSQPAGKSPKAKPRTAEPGLPGQAVSSEAEDGDDLSGKIPKTFGRKR